MIKVVTDKETFDVAKPEDLAANLAKIFPPDPKSDVLVTFVVTTQPTSRRMA